MFKFYVDNNLPFTEALLQRFSLCHKTYVDTLIIHTVKAKSRYEKEPSTENHERLNNSLNKLTDFCIAFADFTASNLINYQGNSDNACVFFAKTLADYTRYIVQYHTNPTLREHWKDICLNYYRSGYEFGARHLRANDHYRLSLALNFTIFLTRVCNQPEEAFGISVEMFDAATSEEPGYYDLDPEQALKGTYGPSVKVIALLQKSISYWADHLCVDV